MRGRAGTGHPGPPIGAAKEQARGAFVQFGADPTALVHVGPERPDHVGHVSLLLRNSGAASLSQCSGPAAQSHRGVPPARQCPSKRTAHDVILHLAPRAESSCPTGATSIGPWAGERAVPARARSMANPCRTN